MIIMRALIATVLLITVVLVSIVLIAANTKVAEDDGPPIGVGEIIGNRISPIAAVHKDEFESMEISPQQSSVTDEQFLNILRTGGSTLSNLKYDTVQSETTADVKTSDDILFITQDNLNTKTDDSWIGISTSDEPSYDSYSSPRIIPTQKQTSSPKEIHFTPDFLINRGSSGIQKDGSTPYTVMQTKASPTISSKTFQTTEKQSVTLPIGYEPGSYVVMDSEPKAAMNSKKENTAAKELDPVSWNLNTPSRERKQRDAGKGSETIVLNTVPIVPHISSEHQVCSHKFPPALPQRVFPQEDQHPHRGLPSIYNPCNWNTQYMNRLRYPQCAECQRDSVPLCKTCGRCSECCQKGRCECGCLRSQTMS